MLRQQETSPETIEIEAATLEDALAEVATSMGPDARILEAKKIQRGGVGGFFAREVVQITARPAADRTSADDEGAGVGMAIDALVNEADTAESGFGELLTREMKAEADTEIGGKSAPQPVGPFAQVETPNGTTAPTVDAETAVPTAAADTAAPAVSAQVASGPSTPVDPTQAAAWITVGDLVAPAPPAPPPPSPSTLASSDADWRTASIASPVGFGRIDWSTTALARIGLPPEIVDPTKGLDPHDDLAWIETVASAVADLCAPFPERDAFIVGAHADRLAEPMGLPLVNPPDMPPYTGSVCAVVSDDQRDLDWLQFVKGDRVLHLVVGDDPWRDLLVDDPAVVSWSGDRGVVDAIYLATTLDGVLGYGTVDGFASGMVRARPVDVALAIRRLAGRR